MAKRKRNSLKSIFAKRKRKRGPVFQSKINVKKRKYTVKVYKRKRPYSGFVANLVIRPKK